MSHRKRVIVVDISFKQIPQRHRDCSVFETLAQFAHTCEALQHKQDLAHEDALLSEEVNCLYKPKKT